MSSYDVSIIGGGPAGLTAGLYVARAGLKSLLLERGVFGGQIVNARLVENYPGFPEGISGSELGESMRRQATKYGLETSASEVTRISIGNAYEISTTEGNIQTKSIIIATGSEYRKLGVAGEERLSGHGVSYCATCDGLFFRDREVAVVGGGDTAINDALELAQYCRKVYIIHRRDQLRATKAMQEKAFSHPKIELVWSTVVHEIIGDKILRSLHLRNVKTGQLSELEVDGIFVAVGLKPNSHVFSELIKLDKAGFIVTDKLMRTPAPGIFAAGDVRQNSFRQAITAAGDGATAAGSAFKYLYE
ncbi:MAG: thioredoxin-disulfide reductase [Dehalococcoidales bacterium]|nr:thioredoxin-disulfide reductase [Dehalococcoidales bacterium]